MEYAESLEKLLQQSDVFTLHLPLSPATHHLIGQEQLAMMKAGSYIVNTARGPIIDETALIDSLKQGHIAGAGLDCFDGEPQVNPGLLNMDNVILAPHHGATVEEVAHEIDMEELAIVDAYLSTGTPLNVVN